MDVFVFSINSSVILNLIFLAVLIAVPGDGIPDRENSRSLLRLCRDIQCLLMRKGESPICLH